MLPNSPRSDEVEHLLRNAQLRDALEPLFDESINRVNVHMMTTGAENDFLESMLEWERAPILPICEWFQPKLELPHPDDLSPADGGESCSPGGRKLTGRLADDLDGLHERELQHPIQAEFLETRAGCHIARIAGGFEHVAHPHKIPVRRHTGPAPRGRRPPGNID